LKFLEDFDTLKSQNCNIWQSYE